MYKLSVCIGRIYLSAQPLIWQARRLFLVVPDTWYVSYLSKRTWWCGNVCRGAYITNNSEQDKAIEILASEATKLTSKKD